MINSEEAQKIIADINAEILLAKYLKSKFGLTLGQIKTKAEKNNIPFALTIDDLLEVVVYECPILKQPIDYVKQGKGSTDLSPSIDRIIPSLGYVKGNVQIVSQKANRLKSNCSEEDIAAILGYIQTHSKSS